MSEIVNKVAQSGIITLDLEDLVPERTESHIDIFNQLFQGLILREKDFRAWVKSTIGVYMLIITWRYFVALTPLFLLGLIC